MNQKQSSVDTILGDDTKFEGKLDSRGTLRIDGRVDGEINAQDSVIIGPSGVVQADIKAASISISGQVTGNINATKKLEVQPTAVISGDILTSIGALTVEAGARIDGKISMSDKESGSQKTESSTTSSATSSPSGNGSPSRAAATASASSE